MKKKKRLTAFLALFILTSTVMNVSAKAAPFETPAAIYKITPTANKHSEQAIQITWEDANDTYVKYYYVMRRSTKNSIGQGNWSTIAKIKSDGSKGGPAYSYINALDSDAPQQYEYKICTLSADGATDTRNASYASVTDETAILGTNMKVCIDAGHFGTKTNNYAYTGADGNFPYSEAVFNLEIAKALQEKLRRTYGIDSYLTRTAPSICLTYNGKTYKNDNLDEKNIAVRGYMAKQQQCDFFISLHTNSTSRQTKIWSQPKSINKVNIFVNQTAHKSKTGMLIANTIGTSLTEYNKKTGIQTAGFTTRAINKAANFSTAQNDSSKTNGTVIHRKSSLGSDYYGILRGAAADGVPGIIVEHAYHVTQIVRKRAASSDLSESWANCDAYGIACGFGF